MRAEFLNAYEQEKNRGQAFALATVIRVEGSASARCGSKAIFNAAGKNIFGWVGGGCAERFISDQSLEALQERSTRIVTADLDDEIFGLGIACGGRMDVFIEPIFPEDVLSLPHMGSFQAPAELLAQAHGWKIETQTGSIEIGDFGDLILRMAMALARVRGRQPRSMRETKDLPLQLQAPKPWPMQELLLIGQGRIVESLARLAVQIGWPVRVFGPSIRSEDFPGKVRCQCLNESYDELVLSAGSAVVVASHQAQDPEFVDRALTAGAAYVAMIGSRKRALEVLEKIQPANHAIAQSRLFVPAGLDLNAGTPEEIAFSLVAEMLLLQKPSTQALA